MSTGRRSMVDYDSTTRDTPADDVILRSSGDVKTCQSCCTWDLCNNGGCGVTG